MSVCSNHRVACPGAGAFAASRGLGLVGRTAVTEMASGGAQGALTYALDPSIGSKSWSGFAGYTASGVVSGGVQGGAASKTNLFLNRHLGGYVAPGQVAWHLPATAAASGAVGGGLGGGLNYAGQQVSTGQDIDSKQFMYEAAKGGLQSGMSSFDVKSLKPVGEIPVMEGVNLGSHIEGSVVAPSSYNTHLVVNGDSYVSPATGQTVYSMPGSLNGVKGEFRVVVEQTDGGEAVRRQFFVPQG